MARMDNSAKRDFLAPTASRRDFFDALDTAMPPCIELNWSELIRKSIVRIFLECSDIVYTSNTRFVESCCGAACPAEPLNGVTRGGMHGWFRQSPMPLSSRKPLFILAVLHGDRVPWLA